MRILDTKQYLDETVKLLENGAKELPVPVSGFSMAPFLSDGDTVILSLPERSDAGMWYCTSDAAKGTSCTG